MGAGSGKVRTTGPARYAVEDLGTLGGGTIARGVNASGQVTGQSQKRLENGAMTHLNSLIPAGSSLRLLDAYAIDASGKIAGSAFNEDNQVRAFLLTPNGAAASNNAADGTVTLANLGFK